MTGSDSKTRDGLTLAVAARELRDLVDSTAKEVLPETTPRVDPLGTGRKDCGPGRQDEDYGIDLEVPADTIDGVVEATAQYWESLGYTVQRESERSDRPAVFIRFEGFNAGLEANKSQGRVALGGSTPCLPKDS